MSSQKEKKIVFTVFLGGPVVELFTTSTHLTGQIMILLHYDRYIQ